MKKLLILAVVSMFTLSGCYQNNIKPTRLIENYEVVVIDSCEYIFYSEKRGHSGYGFMAHKGNCKFCEKRNKK